MVQVEGRHYSNNVVELETFDNWLGNLQFYLHVTIKMRAQRYTKLCCCGRSGKIDKRKSDKQTQHRNFSVAQTKLKT